MSRRFSRKWVVGSLLLLAGGHTGLFAQSISPADARAIARQSVADALTSSVNGDDRGRLAKLQEALARDPDCDLARWHLGQMRQENRWLTATEAERERASDSRHQLYQTRLAALAGDPKRESSLAKWCAGQGYDDLAEFHYLQVLQNSASSAPLQDEARRKLGLQLSDGDWLTEEQIQFRGDQRLASQQAAKRWTDRVQRWTKVLTRGRAKQVEFVRREMREVDDLGIIPVLEQTMSRASESLALEVVAWLSERPQFEATESLLRHAQDAHWDNVRHAAIEALAARPVHDYVPQLLGQLVPPIESRFIVHVSPFAGVVHRHQLYRSGQDADLLAQANFVDTTWTPGVVRVSAPATPPTPRSKYRVGFTRRTPDGKPLTFEERAQEISEMRQRTEWFALVASLRTAAIERNVSQANQLVSQYNSRIYPVLEGTAEAQVPRDPEAWWDWWDSYTESYVPPKKTRFWYGSEIDYHGPVYDFQYARMSCFAAGTRVRTDTGLVAIEDIRPGNRVLSQNVETGELTYKIVNATTERPDAPLLEISLDDATIAATKGHPFWVNGKGWRMAKRLNAGDVLHTLNGPRPIQQIVAKDAAPAYNLVVKDFNTYFVGESGLLVHDNQPRQPTLALTPGFVPE